MADTQEFLDEVIDECIMRTQEDNGQTVNGLNTIREETRQAILQHFQQEQEELKEYATYCCSAKAIGEPFIDGQLFSGRCSDCKEISPLHEVDDEPTRYAEVDGKKPYYTQSKVDRLIRGARISELKDLVRKHTRIHAEQITDNEGAVYLDDSLRYISLYETKERIAELESLSKQKEGSE